MKLMLIWPKGMIGEKYAIFPLSFGYLRNVVPCSLLDCAIDDTAPSEIVGLLQDVDIVGISSWGFNIQNVLETIDVIKKNSNAIVLVGGPSAIVTPADFRILGEGENAFRQVIDGFARDSNVCQSHSIDSNAEIPSLAAAPHDCLDDFGFVDYESLQLEKYLQRGYKYWMYSLSDKVRSAPVIATRGCPYNCAHCQGPLLMGRKIRKHSAGYLLQTIETLCRKHDIKQISFLDDNLTFDADYAKALCLDIIRFKERTRLDFILTSSNGLRLERIDEELIALMKRAGWAEIVIAPESGSPKTLRRMRKNTPLDKVGQIVDMVHRHRMNIVGYFMYGYPGENKNDLELTKSFILNSHFDRCIAHPFTPIPGTPIYDDVVKNGELPANYCIDYRSVSYVPTGLTEDDLRAFRDSISVKTTFREKWIKDL